MAKQDQIKIGIDFEVNQKKIQDLKKKLEELKNIKLSDYMQNNNLFDTQNAQQELNNILQSVRHTSDAISKSFNPKLNTVNIEKFKQELANSGLTMNQLKAQMEKLGPQGKMQFAQVENAIYRVGTAAKESHKLLEKMGTTLANSIKWAASSTLINGFTRSIQQAWGFAKSLDGSLNDIRIVTGKSAQQMERFAKKANDAAQNLGTTTTDYTKASLIYAQQGLSDAQIEAKTETTIKVANVTRQSAEQVSQELTAVWNGYKVNADEAEIYIDRLAAVASNSASSLSELATGMSKVASAAANLGVGEDQLAAQLSTIISVTRQAPETVGTALKTVYARITDIKAGIEDDGTTLGQYSGKLAEMGINVLDASGNLRNMGTVIEQVGNKWGTFTNEQQIFIAQTMAGQRQYSNLIALFDNFDKYNEMLDVANNSTGTLQKQQDTYMDGMKAHLNQLNAAKERMFSSFTDVKKIKPLIDTLSNLANFMGEFIDAIGGGAGALQLLGTIGISVFKDKIADSIKTSVNNFVNARMEAHNLEEQIKAVANAQRELDAQHAAGKGKDQEYKIKSEKLQQEKEILQLQKNSPGYVKTEDLQQLQELIEKLEQAKLKKQQLAEKEGAASADAESILSNFMASKRAQTYVGPVEDTDENGNVKKDANGKAITREATTMDYHKNESVHEDVSAIITDQSNKNTEALDTFKAKAKDLRIAMNEIKLNPESLNLEENQQKIDEFFNFIKENEKSLDENVGFNLISQEQADKAKDVLKEIEEQYLNTFSGDADSINWDKFTQAVEKYKQTLLEAKDNSDALVNATSEDFESIKLQQQQVDENIKQWGQDAEAIKNKIDTGVLVQKFADLSAGIIQCGTAAGQLGNIGKILNSNISPGQKLLRVFMALTTGITSAVKGAQNINKVFKNVNKTFKDTQKQVKKTDKAEKAEEKTQKKSLKTRIAQQKALKQKRKEEKKNKQAVDQSANAEKKAAMADITRTGTLKLVKVGLKAAKAAALEFQASLGVLGTIALAVTAIVSVLTAVFQGMQSAEEQAREAEKEAADQDLQTANKMAELAAQQVEAAKSVQELNEEYKKGNITRAELEDSIADLCEQYQLEAQTVNLLTNSYSNLDQAVAKMQSDAYNQQASAGRLKQAAGLRKNVAENGVYNNLPLTAYGNVGVYSQPGLNEALHFALKNGISLDKVYSYYNTPYTVEDYQSGKVIYQVGRDSLKSNVANIIQYKNALTAINNMAKKGNINSPIYNQLLEGVSKASENGMEDALQGLLESVKGSAMATAAEKAGKVTSFQDYIKMRQDAMDKASQESRGIYSAEETEVYVDQALRSVNKQVYGTYNEKTKALSRFNIQGDPTQEVVKALDKLSDRQIEELLKVPETAISSWKELTVYAERLSGIEISPPYSEGEIERLVTQFQALSDVLEKVRGGKSITKQAYQELPEQLKSFFVRGLNGYDMTGNRHEFETVLQSAQIGELGTMQTESEKKQEAIKTRQEWLQQGEEPEIGIEELRSVENITQLFENDPWLTRVALAFDKMPIKQMTNYGSSMMSYLRMSDFGQSEVGKAKLEELQKKIDDQGINLDVYRAIKGYFDTEIKDNEFLGDLDKELEEQQKKAAHMGELIHEAMFPRDSDVKESDLYNLTGLLKDTILDTEELSNDLLTSNERLNDLASSYLRFNDAVKTTASSIDEWKQALDEGTLTSLVDIRETYADFLDLAGNGQGLSTSFLKNKDNLELLEKAIQGDIDAYNTLQKRARQAILSNATMGEQLKTKFNKAQTDLENIVNKINIGETIDDQYINAMIEILEKTGLTTKQINDYFSSLDIHVQLTYDKTTGKTSLVQDSHGSKAADGKNKFNNLSSDAKKAVDNLQKQRETQKTLTKEAKDQRDFYHDINLELEQAERTLKRIQKVQKRLYGADLIENLNKQQEVLQQQVAILKQKQEIQKADLKNKQSELSGKGITFNLDGAIANYNSAMDQAQADVDAATNYIRSLEQAWNNSSGNKAYQDQLEREITKAKTDLTDKTNFLNDLKSGISDYDKIRKEYEQATDKIEEAIQKEIEIRIQKFNMEASLTLDLNKAQQEWEKFKRNVLERDSVILTTSFQKTNKDAQQNLANAENYYTSGEIEVQTKKINQIMQSIKNINETGQDDIYGDNKTQAIKDAQTAQKQLMKDLQSVQKELDAIDKAYLSIISDIQKMYKAQNDYYKTYREQLKHNIDLVKLVYGQKNYKTMDNYYKKMRKNNNNQLQFLKEVKDKNYAQWKQAEARAEKAAKQAGQNSLLAKEFSADAKAFKEAYLSNISDINSLISSSVKELQEEYSNAIEAIFEEMQNKMTNGKGFSYLDQEWDLMKKKADLYLDSVNSAFAVKNTEFLFQQAINDNDSLLSQQKIKKVMDEQLKILKQKDKLTQYDVDRAQKILEVEKARIALEQARNNKTAMRLKRDSQGNYSYQFTADQDQVDKAENDLVKAENDLYNFDKSNYEEKLKAAYDETKNYQSKMKELAEELAKYENAIDEEGLQHKQQILNQIVLLREQHESFIRDLALQTSVGEQNLLDSAVISFANSYSINKQNFINMTDEKKKAWLEENNGMIPSFKTGIAEMIGRFSTDPDSFENMVSESMNQLDSKRQEYQQGLNELQESAGVNFKEIKQGVDETTESTKELIIENDKLIETMDTEYDKMDKLRARGEELRKKYEDVTKEAEQAVEQFQKMWTQEQTNAINAAATAVNLVATAYNAATVAAESFARTQASSGSDDGENKNNTTQADEDWLILSKGLIDLSNVKVLNDLSYYQGELTPYAQEKVKNFFSSGKDYGEVKKSLLPQTKNLKNDDFRTKFVTEWNKKYQTKIENFDTGGYTGNWSSKQGKLAVLHEKELILNKDDTENMLKMLQIARETYAKTLETNLNKSSYSLEMQELMKEMQDMVQQNVLRTLDLQTKQLNSPQYKIEKEMNKFNELLNSTKQQLEQEVKIEANFPSVTSHKEIEQAFSNLVNLATQKALKYNKN